MSPSSIASLVALSSTILLLYNVHRNDRRRTSRRLRRLFAPIERRKRDRRKGGFLPFVAWALKSRRPRPGFAPPRPRPLNKYR